MPWELGYAEGLLGRCAILPLSPGPEESKMYFGPEYLGLYPYLMRTPIHGQETLFVHTSPESFVLLDSWLQGHDPILH